MAKSANIFLWSDHFRWYFYGIHIHIILLSICVYVCVCAYVYFDVWDWIVYACI